MFRNIFVNKNKQVRSGWKIASVAGAFFAAGNILVGIFVALYTAISVITLKIPQTDISKFTSGITKDLANISSDLGFICNLIQAVCMIFFIVLFWNVYDKKPISEIGFVKIKKGYQDLLKGLGLGAVSLIIVFITLLITGNITLNNALSSPHFSFTLLSGLIVFILVGINEEMFARGYCMTVLRQTGNKYVVVTVSAVIFSLMHSLNPGMNFFCYINLFLFGLLTAYMAIKSGNLWLSIGYHITWNYFEGNICGFLVSGQGVNGLYSLKLPSKNFVNGGKFGPEGGIVVTLIILLNIAYIWKIYRPTYKGNTTAAS